MNIKKFFIICILLPLAGAVDCFVSSVCPATRFFPQALSQQTGGPRDQFKSGQRQLYEKDRHNLKLVGTVIGEGIDSFAILIDPDTGRQLFFHIGDSIKGAVIRNILRGKIILSIDGKEEVLMVKSKSDHDVVIQSDDDERKDVTESETGVRTEQIKPDIEEDIRIEPGEKQDDDAGQGKDQSDENEASPEREGQGTENTGAPDSENLDADKNSRADQADPDSENAVESDQ
ncbi:MAG: hypothetical protein PHP23_00330 [Desulfobacterales bacterium]|nr:hypothetical protein [Desulfobacterales bacterium]MDD4072647.1 hypothetical protein [Desulfobacterales bacterium]MDD4391596.1 hypothetical protein [Desulfobacterales bacterium]